LRFVALSLGWRYLPHSREGEICWVPPCGRDKTQQNKIIKKKCLAFCFSWLKTPFSTSIISHSILSLSAVERHQKREFYFPILFTQCFGSRERQKTVEEKPFFSHSISAVLQQKKEIISLLHLGAILS